MASIDLRAFVRANLPEPPARVLEVGAGSGSLARALRAAGYDVLAIDPRPDCGEDVRPVALADLDEPAGSFAAAVAIVSLHHVDPLEDSCRRLGELVEPGGTLVIDEFDVGAFDLGAAAWWLSGVVRSARSNRRRRRSWSRTTATACIRSSESSRRSPRISSLVHRAGRLAPQLEARRLAAAIGTRGDRARRPASCGCATGRPPPHLKRVSQP